MGSLHSRRDDDVPLGGNAMEGAYVYQLLDILLQLYLFTDIWCCHAKGTDQFTPLDTSCRAGYPYQT
ncbi:MAG: hypothetical protein OXU69_01235 [Gemmatimonadota bacterium]|nr:hypothetical protein [Gemmatimonadota bacterium]MDE2983299.1 hypothetical protein [Gemmatimonadota bacterium]